METITTAKGTFLFVEVHRLGVCFFENMGYLIYQEPDYENYVPDKVLWNPLKLDRWMKKHEGKSDQKRAIIKLPEGNYKFIAVLHSFVMAHHEASQNLTEERAHQIVGDNGMGCYDNYRMKKDEKYTCKTAMDSFSCLMLHEKHSLKIDDDHNYAILKRL